MLNQLQQHRTHPAQPHTDSKKTLALWAILGFAIGLSPIVIFLIFFPTSANNKPIKTPPQQVRINNNPQTTTEPAPTQTQASGIPPAASTPVVQKIQSMPGPDMPVAIAEVHKTSDTLLPAAEKQTDKKTQLENKPEKTIKQGPSSKTAVTTPARPALAPTAKHSAALKQATEDKTETLIGTIVNRRWEQSSPESVFPRTRTIECITEQKDVVCWTDVLTGKYHSREYRYKIKLILDKFSANRQFVMTYRNLILGSNEKSSDDSGGLGALPEPIKPGWAPLINRLPCQLAGDDKMICSPIGEVQFVLKGTPMQTGSRQ